MHIRVELYGVLKSLAQTHELGLELGEGEVTVRDVLRELGERLGLAEATLSSVAAAVGEEMVARSHRLTEGQTVLLLPPVSGG